MGCGMDVYAHIWVLVIENVDFLAMYSGWGQKFVTREDGAGHKNGLPQQVSLCSDWEASK